MTVIDINGVVLKEYRDANFYIANGTNGKTYGFKMSKKTGSTELKQLATDAEEFNIRMIDNDNMDVIAELLDAELVNYNFDDTDEEINLKGTNLTIYK